MSEFKAYGEKTVLFYWLYAAAYMLHIYFDFSGYSDMAIGLGRIFDSAFPKTSSIRMCSQALRSSAPLAHFPRRLVPRLPLYPSRRKPRKADASCFQHRLSYGQPPARHGASWNFVLWGLLYAVLLLFEKYILRPQARFSVPMHIYTLLFVMLGFVLFDAASVAGAFMSFKSMFGFAGIPAMNAASLYYLKSNLVLLTVAVVGATPCPNGFMRKSKGRRAEAGFLLFRRRRQPLRQSPCARRIRSTGRSTRLSISGSDLAVSHRFNGGV